MTTGSWNRDSYVDFWAGGWTGIKSQRSWSGADRTVQRYERPPLRTVIRNGKTHSFRERRVGISKPPKRAYDVDHEYTMDETRLTDELARFILSDGTPLDRPVMWLTATPTWAAASLLTANDQLKLVGKLREKLQGSDFNMSVFLGEGHQTLKMIGDTAIKLAKALHHLRRGDLAGTARSLLEGTSRKPIKPYKQMRPFRPTAERASSHWLELQYGWLPLLKDVEAGAQAVAHKLSVPAQQTYRMSVRREDVQTRTVTGYKSPITTKSSRVHRRSLKVIVSEHPSALAQLGLLNPELVAWELLPFSFVADWFLPIGSYLEARAVVSSIVATYVTSDLQTGTAFHPEPSAGMTSRVRAEYNSVHFARTISSAPKLPLPAFKSLKEAASWQHCANAIALLTQAAIKPSGIRF
jgi:hypothetical protein